MLKRISPRVSTQKTQSTIATITPERALNLLNDFAYPYQRKTKKEVIRRYASQMRSGLFLGGTTIVVAECEGRSYLIDGQHRLHAVVESESPTEFVIVTHLVENMIDLARMYAHIDIGSVRTTSDMYHAYNLPEQYNLTQTELRSLGAAVLIIRSNMRRSSDQDVTRDERLRLVDLYLPYMQQYRVIRAGVNKYMERPSLRSSVVSVVLLSLRFSAVNHHQKTMEFWDGVLKDDGLAQADPRKWAYNHISKTTLGSKSNTKLGLQSVSVNYQVRYIARCFDRFVDGDTYSMGPKVFDENDTFKMEGVPDDQESWITSE